MKMSLFLLLTLLSLTAFAQIQPKWEKVETKEKVEVFRGDVENSDVVAFRGVSVIDASIAKVSSVIYDVSRIKEWMSDVNDVKLIEKISKFEKIEYNRTKAPWPLSDRDFVYSTKVNLNKAEKSLEILVVSVEHKDAPPVKDVVRGHLYLSRYFLKSLENDTRTHIEVEILADPKGSVPKWVVNMFQSTWPVNTVNGIRKIATEKDYQIHPDLAETVTPLNK